MDVGPLVVADAPTTELIESSGRQLDDPAPPPQAAAVLRAAHGQQRRMMRPQAVPDGRWTQPACVLSRLYSCCPEEVPCGAPWR